MGGGDTAGKRTQILGIGKPGENGRKNTALKGKGNYNRELGGHKSRVFVGQGYLIQRE